MMGEIDAAYAKGLEDAIAVMQRAIDGDYPVAVAEVYRADGKPSKHDRCPHGRARYEGCESCLSDFLEAEIVRLRALSPLPPGSRVVVVPPEGSAEFEALVEHTAQRRFEANVREAVARDPDEHSYAWSGITEAAQEGWRWQVRGVLAALRAMTGGDDRG